MVQALESLVFTFILRAPLQSAHCSFQLIVGGTVAQMFKEPNSGATMHCCQANELQSSFSKWPSCGMPWDISIICIAFTATVYSWSNKCL